MLCSSYVCLCDTSNHSPLLSHENRTVEPGTWDCPLKLLGHGCERQLADTAGGSRNVNARKAGECRMIMCFAPSHVSLRDIYLEGREVFVACYVSLQLHTC